MSIISCQCKVFVGGIWACNRAYPVCDRIGLACPNLYIRIFMSSTPAILAIAPAIIRIYALSFLLLPFNIFSTYYFQAILQPVAFFIVSVARGLVISGFLILLLPILFHAESLWLAMPLQSFWLRFMSRFR